MRIGIDARILGHPRSGIAVYVTNLVEQFLKHKDLEVILFGDRPICEEYKYITDRVKTVIFGQAHRKRWAQFYLPGQLKKYKIDIYHATWNSAVPIFTRVPSVLTVHDLIPLVVEGYFKNNKKRFKYVYLLHFLSARAAAIITDAENTKLDLIKYFNTPKEKIKVVHLGIKEDYQAADNDKQRVLDKFGINRDYVINIGSFDKRRNLETLIKAFSLFIKNANRDSQLVLVGNYYNFKREVGNLKVFADNLSLKGRVIFTDYVTGNELSALLKSAKIMVHLSLYEGFCFPVLEAMQVGVPVVASNTGSIPEIAGDAAVLVDPLNEEDTARAIESLWLDQNKSGIFIKKGLERIKIFSWEKTAQETISIYRKVLNIK